MKKIDYATRGYDYACIECQTRYRLRILELTNKVGQLEAQIQEHCREIERIAKKAGDR